VPRTRSVLAATCLIAAACVAAAPPGAGAALRTSGLLPFGCAAPAGRSVHDGMSCFGAVRLGVGFLDPDVSTGPVGLRPKDIRDAYGLVGLRAHGRTVAIVDAFDDPNAEADLAVYRAAYGLPPCTTANGCFRKVNQDGQAKPLPAPDYGWAEEISLDLDAVSATCPSCHILLVEANGPTTRPLMAAVETAVRLGAVAVSNSYGGHEDKSVLRADVHLYHPGVAVTASSGDSGYGVQWPASSPYVTAVGGTSLSAAGNGRGWTETAWAGAGSGCSKFEAKPSWQTDNKCGRRMVADVAAVADPATGLGVYDTFNNCVLALLCDAMIGSGAAKGLNGWAQIGGTSLSAPIVAAVYALAGNHHRTRYLYAHQDALYDVLKGSNGSCPVPYYCTARVGYDGPTGLGTPHGTGAF
jgi:subtilase family serine protease